MALSDAFIVVIAGLLANFPIPIYAERIGRPELFAFLSTCVVCCLAALLLTGAYNKLWRYFSRNDYISCIIGVVLGYAVAICLYYIITDVSYLRFSALSCLLTAIGICLFRFAFRDAFLTIAEVGRKDAERKRTMIIGAGEAGKLLITEINRLPAVAGAESPKIEPVCLIDDDRNKIGSTVCGVLVSGGTRDIVKVAKAENVEQIIFATPREGFAVYR